MFKQLFDQHGYSTAEIGDGMVIRWETKPEPNEPPWEIFVHHEPGPIYQYMNEILANARKTWNFQHSAQAEIADAPHELSERVKLWKAQEIVESQVKTPQERIKEAWQDDLRERNQPPVEFS